MKAVSGLNLPLLLKLGSTLEEITIVSSACCHPTGIDWHGD